MYAAALAVVDASVHAQDFRLREESTTRHTLRFAGAGDRSLTIRNTNGSIRVTGSSDDAVQLEVRRVVRADTPDDVKRGMNEAMSTTDGRADVEAVVRDANGATCGDRNRTGGRNRNRDEPPYTVSYDFVVTVPAGTRLILCTVNGSEDVVRTSGDFEIESVNGPIRMTDVRGSGRATTVNGAVDASFLDVPKRDSTFKTVNGSVTVIWPEDLSANLRLKTMNGGLFTDFDVQAQAASPVSRSRSNGRWVYRSDDAASVQVGQGGPLMTLESLNGNIRVLRAGSR
jgi:hypothetical protein